MLTVEDSRPSFAAERTYGVASGFSISAMAWALSW